MANDQPKDIDALTGKQPADSSRLASPDATGAGGGAMQSKGGGAGKNPNVDVGGVPKKPLDPAAPPQAAAKPKRPTGSDTNTGNPIDDAIADYENNPGDLGGGGRSRVPRRGVDTDGVDEPLPESPPEEDDDGDDGDDDRDGDQDDSDQPEDDGTGGEDGEGKGEDASDGGEDGESGKGGEGKGLAEETPKAPAGAGGGAGAAGGASAGAGAGASAGAAGGAAAEAGGAAAAEAGTAAAAATSEVWVPVLIIVLVVLIIVGLVGATAAIGGVGGASKDGGIDSGGGSVGGGSANCGKLSGTPKEIVDKVALPIAHKIDFKQVTAKSVEAANAGHGPTTSGTTSDHQGPPERAWAADISNGSSPTKEMDQLAKDLADCFGFQPSQWQGDCNTTTKDGYRIQLIYRTNCGANHFNHVHIGVAKE